MQYAYKNGKILNGTKEMHVHLAGNGKPQKKQRDNAKLVKTLMSNGISRAIAYRMVAGFAKDELLSGVTTIRTVGGLGTFDTRLRDEIKAGKRQARESLPQMRESSTVRKKPSPTTSPLSLETMSDARGLHSTTSGGNSFTSINMSEFPTYSRSTPQPPAPPRWQESEPKPERSSRENVQTSSSPQRIRSKISVLCARSKWLSRREEKSTIRR